MSIGIEIRKFLFSDTDNHFKMSEGGMVDFFEGREKTVRVYFTVPECCSLLDLETDVWEKLLKQTGCSIIGLETFG